MNKTIYGGFWKRAVAFIVDSIIATLPPLIICLPLMLWQIYSIAKSPDGGLSHLVFLMLLIVAMQVLILLSVWLYFALMESGKRQAQGRSVPKDDAAEGRVTGGGYAQMDHRLYPLRRKPPAGL